MKRSASRPLGFIIKAQPGGCHVSPGPPHYVGGEKGWGFKAGEKTQRPVHLFHQHHHHNDNHHHNHHHNNNHHNHHDDDDHSKIPA